MNLESIKKIINNVDIVCFDIFDTIVSRKCYPDYTKKLFSSYLNRILKLDLLDNDIWKIRIDSEKELGEMNQKLYGEYEFTYANLTEKMYNKIQGKSKISYEEFNNICTKLEISIEKNVQHVNEDILEIMKYCKKNKKVVICISDMYLSKTMLLDILTYHNLDNYIDEIYVSSEFTKSKRTGSLYKKVMEDYKKNANKFLMIGDNEYSDFNIPKTLGMYSYRVIRNDIMEYYKKDYESKNSKTLLKELSYLKTNKSFEDEYKIYKFIEKVFFEIYNREGITIKISDDSICRRFNEYRREIFAFSNINIISKGSCDLEIEGNNDLICSIDGHAVKTSFDMRKMDMQIYRNIVKLLQNICDEKTILEKQTLIDKKTINSVPKRCKHNMIAAGESYSRLFYKFIDWILEDCCHKEIDKVYFFTREGEFFYQIASRIKKHSNIDKYVLEVSRLSTFCPSIRNVTIEEMMRLWNQYSVQSMDTFFKTLGLNLDLFIPLLEKYKLTLNENILFPFDDLRVKSLFNDNKFKKILQDEIDNKKNLILNYFKTKNLSNKKGKIAIVDIGWRGTIQDNICYILPEKEIHGYYFGLINYLNKQPKNSYKQGFLNQYSGGIAFLENVTPIEMLCNSPFGSTIGYNNDGKAIRKIDEFENQSYETCVKYVQEGILNKIDSLDGENIPDKDILNILNSIIYFPTKEIAKTYFNLKHNEEFGLGKYVDKSSKFNYINLFLAPVSKKYRNRFRQSIIDSTWNQGYLKVNHLGMLNKHYAKKINNFMKNGKKKIAWFLPPVIKGSGGHRTIIQNANILVKAGYSCDLYFDEDFYSTSESMKEKLIEYFGECLCNVYIGSVLRDKYDLVMGTHAILTADYVKNCDCQNKGYFIQDFEPWFMPMGEAYLSMEGTYNYDFKGVSIGRWLAHKIQTEYHTMMKYFNFCADLSIYKPLNDIPKENAICFIYQPEKPRRCPNLGIQALMLVKKLRPEIKIYLYGSNCDVNYLECENLHIINLKKCNELYNKCKVGLCISASNPSRIPFEMMAAGLPVVDLYRENNLYDMPDGGVLLANPTPEAIATALIKIYDDNNLAAKMSKVGFEYMQNYPLEKGFNQFISAVDSMFDNKYDCDVDISKTYLKEPIYASEEVLKEADIIKLKPYFRNTSPFVRKLVKTKKNMKNKYKNIVRKLFRL